MILIAEDLEAQNVEDNRCSLVTVKNWQQYQSDEQLVSSKRAANEQLVSTNKEDKKIRNKETNVGAVTQSLHDYIGELCQQAGIDSKVKIQILDELVNRHRGLQLRVEVRKCVSWLVDHGKRDLSTMRLTNWFAKASEIQKRDENKRLDWMQAQKDPALAQHLRATGNKPKNIERVEPFVIDPATKAKLLSPSNPPDA